MKPINNEKRPVVTGYFTDEHQLLNALMTFKSDGIKVLDVHTPFHVHGIDKVLELPQNEGLSRVGFAAGVLGLLMGFGMQALISVKLYPINFGGKPFLAVPSFMPVVIMLVFLFSAFAIALAFMAKSGLGAGASSLVVDDNTTNDRFLVVIEGGDKTAESTLRLNGLGALGVQTNNIQTTR